MSVCADLSMTTGGCGVCVEACLVWRLGVPSVCVDISLVVMTIGGTVCVEACMVWGQNALSACVDFSLVSTIGGCTESVIVVASTVATTGGP